MVVVWVMRVKMHGCGWWGVEGIADIMSDHAQFELTFTKVGNIYDTCMHHTNGPDNSSELLIDRKSVV